MRRCFLCGCTASKAQCISLHRMPQEQCLFERWADFARVNYNLLELNGHSFICSRHFEKDCFHRQSGFEGQQRRLKEGSIPTVRFVSTSCHDTTKKVRLF